MDFESAKREAVRIFGAGTTLHKDKGGWCFVQEAATQRVLGKGRSWLEALREATAPILRKAAEDQELQRRQDMAEFERFLTFLREHLKDQYLAWRKARDEENAKLLAEAQANDAAEKAAAEEPAPVLATTAPEAKPDAKLVMP